MKPGKLYIKIFLSFLGVLIITELVIFVIFLVFPGRHFRKRFEQYTAAKVMIVKEVVEDIIESQPDTNISDNIRLKKFIINFGNILGAKVWLQKADGTLLLKSFDADIPDVEEPAAEHRKDFGNFMLYHDLRKHFEFYAVIPIIIHQESKGSINVLFERRAFSHPEGVFALGLAVVGIIIAVLIIPVSRLITDPIKQLRFSALKIAEGELSHRATVKSRDEIGELGHAFNHMADKLERMIQGGKELTANVSHELRSPLARIRVAEELIRERVELGDIKDLKKHLDDIREDVEELDHLIGRILTLSKLDIHEKKPKLEPIDPVGMVNELLERFDSVIDQKGLNVKSDLSFNPPFIGNREALYTMFSNTLDNAVKFSPENGTVIVRMNSELNHMKFIVTNTYEKLQEKELEQIFDPFHRVESAPASGTGLGLAIVKKIVELHGGSVQALNSDEGFEIVISLPAGSSVGGT